jgi:hypothetical protein
MQSGRAVGSIAPIVAVVADRGPASATPGRDGALRRPGHRSAMSLPRRSRYVVANALDHPIDSRINLSRKLSEFCDLIGSKNRPNLFAKMRAPHREISFELPDTASLGTDGRSFAGVA